MTDRTELVTGALLAAGLTMVGLGRRKARKEREEEVELRGNRDE